MTAFGITRELKRLLAEIAAAGPEDREAILDELDPDLRARASAMLGELEAAATLPEPAPAPEILAPVVPEPVAVTPEPVLGLSTWLSERLDQARSPNGSFAGVTRIAAAVLAESAQMLSQSALESDDRAVLPLIKTGQRSPLERLLFPKRGRR